MRNVEGREDQLRNISDIREKATAIGILIISNAKKEKELINDFYSNGKMFYTSQPYSLNHDLGIFPDDQIAQLHIYDIITNTIYSP